MRAAGIIALALALAGCKRDHVYSPYADSAAPMESRLSSLDARLRALLGDPSPDTSRLSRLLDSLGASASASDSDAVGFCANRLRGIASDLRPSDSDLVPTLAWERRRAGCVPLVLFWTTLLRGRNLEAVSAFLPGHLVVALPDGRLIETLRGGIERPRAFYDSVFSLRQRPYYAGIVPDTNGVLASMLVQAGLLEWRAGDLVGAESALDAAVRICPGLPEAEGNLGLVLEQNGRSKDALERLDRALQGDSLAVGAAGHQARLRSTGGDR